MSVTLDSSSHPISLFEKKVGLLWTVMMDDSAPTHDRRKLVNLKPYKNMLPSKRTRDAEVRGET